MLDKFGLLITCNVFFLGVNAIFQKLLIDKKVTFLSASGCSIIFGIIAGLFLVLQNIEEEFSSKIFSYLMLPLIRFATGLNNNLTQFTKSMCEGFLFGCIGTLFYQRITYIVISWLNNEFNFITGNEKDIDFMFFALSISLCSKDYVTALKVMSYRRKTHLYSLILAEGFFNDITTFGMFVTFQSDQKEFWQMSFGVFFIMIMSIISGLLVGMLIILTLKHVRFILDSVLFISVILFFFGYMSFTLAQSLSFSGLIAANISGLFVNIYFQHNVPSDQQQQSLANANFFNFIFGMMIFFYIGTVFWNNIPSFSQNVPAAGWYVILLFFIAIFTIRMTGTFLIYLGIKVTIIILRKQKMDLSFRDIFVFFLTGIVRGPVAFVTIMLLQSKDEYIYIAQSTVNIIIIGTNLVIGSLTDYITKSILGSDEMGIFKSEQKTKQQSCITQTINKIFIYNYTEREQQIEEEDINRQYKEEIVLLDSQLTPKQVSSLVFPEDKQIAYLTNNLSNGCKIEEIQNNYINMSSIKV